MSFNAVRENKIHAKISEFTVLTYTYFCTVCKPNICHNYPTEIKFKLCKVKHHIDGEDRFIIIVYCLVIIDDRHSLCLKKSVHSLGIFCETSVRLFTHTRHLVISESYQVVYAIKPERCTPRLIQILSCQYFYRLYAF